RTPRGQSWKPAARPRARPNERAWLSIQLQPCGNGIARTVYPLDRRPELRNSPSQQLFALRRDEFAHVDHLEQFALAELCDCQSSEAELDRTPFERGAMGIVIRVPLQAHLRCRQRRLPCLVRRVARLLKTGSNGLREQIVEEPAAQSQPE